ncbi:hypothetical protein DEJ51_08115 [Streptomyces venezuelae]|uniref:Uncharacterized protein n=1 Tax=Streptomyces venezuelae TaxID=54571 RepID=A0A5P2DN53_STRVZ|nr:hypothetical protein DEJ51_08115 [Streptomyces venezuelae]
MSPDGLDGGRRLSAASDAPGRPPPPAPESAAPTAAGAAPHRSERSWTTLPASARAAALPTTQPAETASAREIRKQAMRRSVNSRA